MKSRSCMPEPDNEKGGRELTKREVVSIREAADVADTARCPLCHAMLIARQGRHGPYFYCACLKQAA